MQWFYSTGCPVVNNSPSLVQHPGNCTWIILMRLICVCALAPAITPRTSSNFPTHCWRYFYFSEHLATLKICPTDLLNKIWHRNHGGHKNCKEVYSFPCFKKFTLLWFTRLLSYFQIIVLTVSMNKLLIFYLFYFFKIPTPQAINLYENVSLC